MHCHLVQPEIDALTLILTIPFLVTISYYLLLCPLHVTVCFYSLQFVATCFSSFLLHLCNGRAAARLCTDAPTPAATPVMNPTAS